MKSHEEALFEETMRVAAENYTVGNSRSSIDKIKSILLDRAQGMTYKELGIKHNLSKERCRQIVQRAIRIGQRVMFNRTLSNLQETYKSNN